jgi:uncharacterized protein YecT (DUF1311 family)
MLRTAVLTAAALIGAAVVAYAGAQGDPETSCVGGTYQMVDCLAAQTAQWDKKMTAAYRALMKELEPKPQEREQLRAAQRLWIKYRDANCLYYRLGEGSIAIVDGASCFLRMTKERALELEGPGDRN